MSTTLAKRGVRVDDLLAGDRIRRTWFGESRIGTVVEVYDSVHNLFDDFHLFYTVRWDDTGLTERGYMRHGLQKIDQPEA
jgi:hypothetical protein